MNIKKIIKEVVNDFEWIRDTNPDASLKHGGTEVAGGHYWHISSYPEWIDLYSNMEDIKNLKPRWAITPSKTLTTEKYFKMYQDKYGDLNIFLTHDKDEIYAWFDDQTHSFNKLGTPTDIPI